MELEAFAKQHPLAALGFSGGVDSSFLLYAGRKSGADWRPVFLRTAFKPAFELEDAQRLCREISTELTVLDFDILAVPGARENPENRCYHCKRAMLGRLIQWAKSLGISVILDGNNASDPPDDRPGMRAAAEFGVLSPLREAGLTKQDIRRLAREAGLFTWNKPSYACLATRIPAGTPIEKEMLQKVEQGEAALRMMGFSDLRIRILQDCARVQLPEDQMERAMIRRKEIVCTLKAIFPAVLLDLEPRPAQQ